MHSRLLGSKYIPKTRKEVCVDVVCVGVIRIVDSLSIEDLLMEYRLLVGVVVALTRGPLHHHKYVLLIFDVMNVALQDRDGRSYAGTIAYLGTRNRSTSPVTFLPSKILRTPSFQSSMYDIREISKAGQPPIPF